MLRAVASTAVIAFVLGVAACGGDDGESNSDSEAEARGVVADFMVALGGQDADAACEALTPEAREQVEQLGRSLELPPGDCAAVLDAVVEGPGAEEALAPIADLAEQVRSGDVEDGEVTVAVEGTEGTVTLTAGEGTPLPVPVEQVNGEWLVGDAQGLLFGTGG